MTINGPTKPTKAASWDHHHRLGLGLAFVAGAINSGGFVAIGMFTSPMTGSSSSLAEDVAKGQFPIEILGALLSFIIGAMLCTLFIHRLQQKQKIGLYTLPLAIEAILLAVSGLFGFADPWLGVSYLALTMGWQNATITILSNAKVRSTHVTGTVTDIGIAIGRFLHHYFQRGKSPMEPKHKEQFTYNLFFLGVFILGGIVGTVSFLLIHMRFMLLFALILFALIRHPLFQDKGHYLKSFK